MTNLPLSLVVITLNEQENIQRCLKSVPFAQDIIVLDSGSTDRTREVAESMGARVFNEKWRGYYGQKVRATELAKHDWVLSLDADEALSSQLIQEIQALFAGKNGELADGYEMARLSFHLGRWIRHGGWYPDRQIRLFHRQRCQWRSGHLHERVEGNNIARAKGNLLHYVFKDLADQVETNNEYSSLGAKDLVAQGKAFILIKLIFKPLLKFIETYIYNRGFLDGLPGFIIAVGASYSLFLKYAKHWEMTSKKDLHHL